MFCNFAADIKQDRFMQTTSTYRAQARQSLQGRWGDAALSTLVYFLIALVCCAPSIPSALYQTAGVITWWSESLNGLAFVVGVFLLWPLQYALYNAFLALTRGSEESVWDNVWSNFKNTYSTLLQSALLAYIIVVLLSVVTLCIGGVIFSYAYRMVPYLINDYPNLTPKEALRTSRQMMKGHKWDLFVLDLSFIGWIFLAILTCGIGYMWLTPYMYTATAHFYEDLKAEKIVDEDAEQAVEEVEVEEA